MEIKINQPTTPATPGEPTHKEGLPDKSSLGKIGQNAFKNPSKGEAPKSMTTKALSTGPSTLEQPFAGKVSKFWKVTKPLETKLLTDQHKEHLHLGNLTKTPKQLK